MNQHANLISRYADVRRRLRAPSMYAARGQIPARILEIRRGVITYDQPHTVVDIVPDNQGLESREVGISQEAAAVAIRRARVIFLHAAARLPITRKPRLALAAAVQAFRVDESMILGDNRDAGLIFIRHCIFVFINRMSGHWSNTGRTVQRHWTTIRHAETRVGTFVDGVLRSSESADG